LLILVQSLVRPDEDELEKSRKETQAALDKIVCIKLNASQPTSLAPQPGAPTYIKYTPAQQGSQYNSGAAHRIIKMQDMPVDPMEPPKFRAKKVSLPQKWDTQD
jgi:SNW domain-containing protein 1